MKNIILMAMLLFSFITVFSQNSISFKISDENNKEELPGATVVLKETSNGTTTDYNGHAELRNIPNGEQTIIISFIGYEKFEKEYIFPLSDTLRILVELEADSETLEQVTVSTTRSSRTVQDIPTRIETIGIEELGEKAVMNSSNIAMLLRESTGIQMQQTSPNSANQSIRIQGLDGRYTQILKDGFPLYGGFASGLSIMQIPPLDLKQVEILKGSNSTLYGGGAIAGLVNLISKTPENKPITEIMLNQTSALGSTANIFHSQRNGKVGFTLYGSGTYQFAHDVNNDNFTELPETKSVNFNPKFYYYFNDSTTFMIGLNSSFDERIGGDINVIEGNEDENHIFSETNISKRVSSQISFDKKLKNNQELSIKNSISYFDRLLQIPNYSFQGQQIASFSELSYYKKGEKTDWIAGANFYTDKFTETPKSNSILRTYENNTAGIFVQNTWFANKIINIETGMRTDFNTNYDLFFLPRISALLKINKHLSSRIGGGLGYKLPTMFIEEAEVRYFQNIQPIDINNIKAEKSAGGNFDINYKTILFNKLSFSINQMFFYTQLQNSVVLRENSNDNTLFFENADGNLDTKGFETNIKFTYNDWKLFMYYTFTDTKLNYDNINKQKPLTPQNTFGAVLFYEVEEKWHIGLEAYYTGYQYKSDYTKTKSFWRPGFMVRRDFEHISIFANFENFIDTRQSKYETMVLPPVNNPSFTEIWAPTDGFVANAGIVIKL